MDQQKEVWEKIAKQWQSFKEKQKPIKEAIDFITNSSGNVLDLGCGSGRNFRKIKGKIYGVDFSDEMLKLAEKHAKEKGIDARLFKAEADSLPFKNDFFDSALFVATLHCIESKEKRKNSLKELFRVLKKRGRAMITVWSRNQKRIRNKPKEAFIPWTVNGKKYMRYYYIYDRDELKDLLEEVGFKILSLKEDENIIAVVEK